MIPSNHHGLLELRHVVKMTFGRVTFHCSHIKNKVNFNKYEFDQQLFKNQPSLYFILPAPLAKW